MNRVGAVRIAKKPVSFLLAFSMIAVAFVIGSPLVTRGAAGGNSPTFSVTCDAVQINGFTYTFSGTWATTNFPGQADSYDVKVNAPTGTVADASSKDAPDTFATTSQNGNTDMSGTWSNEITFSSAPGSASASLYHAQPSGAESNDAACSFTNLPPPGTATLTLVKNVTNDNGGNASSTDWTLSADGPSNISGTSGNASVTNVTVSPGSYDLSESGGPSGYTPSNWVCSGGSQVDGDTVTLADDDTATCTITNNDNAATSTTGTLVVKKVVVNDNGGSAATSSFSFQVNGTSTTAFEADGENDLVVAAGTYSVTEVAASGYTPAYDNCSNVVVPADGTATCTITNNDDAVAPTTGTLTVQKVIINDNGGTGTSTDFAFKVDNGATTTFEADGSNDVVLAFGTHSVSEVSAPGYSTTYSNCEVDLSLATSSATCIITNDDNNPNAGRFTLTVTTSGNGNGVVQGDAPTSTINCDSNSDEDVCSEVYPAGTVVTLHADPDSGSNFNSSWSGACSGNNPVCTITMNGNTSVNAHFALNSSRGGSGGSGGSSGSGGGSTGSVLGASTTTPEVLGEQIALVPAGAPNTGAGGMAQEGFYGLLLALAGVYGVSRARKVQA